MICMLKYDHKAARYPKTSDQESYFFWDHPRLGVFVIQQRIPKPIIFFKIQLIISCMQTETYQWMRDGLKPTTEVCEANPQLMIFAVVHSWLYEAGAK